jgi:bromodomain-containing factor 1
MATDNAPVDDAEIQARDQASEGRQASPDASARDLARASPPPVSNDAATDIKPSAASPSASSPTDRKAIADDEIKIVSRPVEKDNAPLATNGKTAATTTVTDPAVATPTSAVASPTLPIAAAATAQAEADAKSDTSDDIEMADVSDTSVIADAADTETVTDAPGAPDAPADTPVKHEKAEDAAAATHQAQPDATPNGSHSPIKQEAVIKNSPIATAAETTNHADAHIKPIKSEEPGANSHASPSIKSPAPRSPGKSPVPQSDDGLGVSKLAIDREGEAASLSADVSMTDAPAASSKLVREREADDDEEPAAKRVRTTDDESGTPAPAWPADKPSTGLPELDAIPRWLDSSFDRLDVNDGTRRLYRHYLALAKKTTSGSHFRDSVSKMWPNLAESYNQIITTPMDLGEIDRKMRDGRYETVGQMRDDLQLIYTNCLKFNGADSWLIKSAVSTLEVVWKRIIEVKVTDPPPKPAKPTPSRHETRVKNPPPAPATPTAPAPPPAAPPAQQSRRQSSVVAPSPTVDGPAEQVYAVPPGGVPQIRRASTLSDGTRPKRAIQAPKNKDIEYSTRPSKKTLKPELQFCEKVVNDLMSQKHALINAYFLEPVDPVFHRIPNYFSVIRKPMDLGTIAKKLASGEYQNTKQFEADFKLIVSNCIKFNGEQSPVSLAANSLDALFKEEMASKAAWMAKHAPKTPVAEPASGHNSDADTDDDDNEAASAPPEPRKPSAQHANSTGTGASPTPAQLAAVASLKAKLEEEVEKITTLYLAPEPNMAMIEVQQLVINQFKQALAKAQEQVQMQAPSEPAKSTPKAKPSAKPAKPKPVKDSPAVAKRASTGAAKKAAPLPTKKKRRLTADERAKLPDGINNLPPADVNRAIELIKRDTGQAVSAFF